MTQIDQQISIRENKAQIILLNKKIDALIAILEKEGVASSQEVSELTKELIEDEQNQ